MTANRVFQGDCVQVLPQLPSSCVDLVLTDPPYFGRYRDRQGRTLANDDNPQMLYGAFAQMFRVLRPNTFCVVFYGYPRLHTFVDAWTEAGFDTVGHMVWPKPYASSARFLRVMHESAYLLAKGRPAKPAKPLDDVQRWEYSGNRIHPTEKAIVVLRPLVEAFCVSGGLVLDPFAGSGSSLVAAALSGRSYLGVELEEKYCQLAHRRLAGVTRYRKAA